MVLLVHDHGIQQTLAAHSRDVREVESRQVAAEDLAKLLQCEFEGRRGNGTSRMSVNV